MNLLSLPHSFPLDPSSRFQYRYPEGPHNFLAQRVTSEDPRPPHVSNSSQNSAKPIVHSSPRGSPQKSISKALVEDNEASEKKSLHVESRPSPAKKAIVTAGDCLSPVWKDGDCKVCRSNRMFSYSECC
jgi:hypothetical protein